MCAQIHASPGQERNQPEEGVSLYQSGNQSRRLPLRQKCPRESGWLHPSRAMRRIGGRLLQEEENSRQTSLLALLSAHSVRSRGSPCQSCPCPARREHTRGTRKSGVVRENVCH